MKSVKNKLSSKSGASMLLALVFLMFCMLVGGSVLSAATANGSRAARQKENQQAYLSQRSASLLLADMLKSTDEAAMQLTIKDVTSGGTRTITFMAHGAGPQSEMQMLLYDIAVSDYISELGNAEYTPGFVNFPNNYSVPTGTIDSGTITVALNSDKATGDVHAKYYIVGNSFVIDYIFLKGYMWGFLCEVYKNAWVRQ